MVGFYLQECQQLLSQLVLLLERKFMTEDITKICASSGNTVNLPFKKSLAVAKNKQTTVNYRSGTDESRCIGTGRSFVSSHQGPHFRNFLRFFPNIFLVLLT